MIIVIWLLKVKNLFVVYVDYLFLVVILYSVDSFRSLPSSLVLRKEFPTLRLSTPTFDRTGVSWSRRDGSLTERWGREYEVEWVDGPWSRSLCPTPLHLRSPSTCSAVLLREPCHGSYSLHESRVTHSIHQTESKYFGFRLLCSVVMKKNSTR